MSMNTFETEFQTGLASGASTADLLEIVLRHKSFGLSQKDTYITLERILAELRTDNQGTDESPLV